MAKQQLTKTIPAYAMPLLAAGEAVRYLTRPRLLSMGMFIFMVTVLLGLTIFSLIVEPGFLRMLSLPALPIIGSLAASLVHSPAIFVTDRRIVFARRFLKPQIFPIGELQGCRVKQGGLGRLLGYGELLLFFRHPEDRREGVFLVFTLSRLPDAASLGAAVTAAADELHIREEDLP